VSRARPGKRRDLVFRDRALTVAIALAAAAFGAGALVPLTEGDSGRVARLADVRADGLVGTSTSLSPSVSGFQGKPARWWAQRAVHNRKTINRLRAGLRQQVRLGPHGVTQGLLCIHSFEGSWTDPAAPHWGGLQMDLDFQRSYGGEFLAALGTADRWPPFVQLAVAMRAYYAGRGYGPWPNTRKRCGI
jgi:hypothetical protein